MAPKKTPLYDIHCALGGRLVDFAGFEMPVQYSSVIKEHRAVREGVALFDVSHMGEIEIAGPGALETLQHIATNDASRLVDGQCQYSPLCYPGGGVVDDIIVYRYNEEKYMLCVNASNTAKVFDWILGNNPGNAEIIDLSDATAQIAVQGPLSTETLKEATGFDPGALKYYHFAEGSLCGHPATISRTGYTGERGYELYCRPENAAEIWTALMEAGKERGIIAAGLGARDTLRLEMGFPLYGSELSRDITPLEARLDRFVALGKDSFCGRDVLLTQSRNGIKKALVGLTLKGRGIARAGHPITIDGKVVGQVTSGTHSPSLGRSIALGFIEPQYDAPGSRLAVLVRGREIEATVVKTPFYKKKKA